MTGAPSIPVWFVALVLAAAAPWVVRGLQVALERRVRRRTLDFVAGALAAAASTARGTRGVRSARPRQPEHETQHEGEREQAAESESPRRP